ncbi:MAG: penicillin-binding protein 2 [Rhodospirillales bacterium]|nr:penicillin-binding protein 2 [Rhodospirillales bacterium]
MTKRFFFASSAPAADPRIGGRTVLKGVRNDALETGRLRLLVTGAAFLLAFGVIAYRLVEVTAIDPEHRNRPVASAKDGKLRFDRADIVDRNGVVLATGLPTVSLYANPREIRDPEAAAEGIARVLPDLNAADLKAKLAAEKGFVYLKRNLTPRQQYEINRLGVPGLNFEAGERRLYPQGSLAAHVIGMADLDGKGIAGIEKTFDGQLRQETGEPLALSIDVRVQHVLRTELAEAVQRFQAIGATGVVLDVRTGEILAMVSLPDFDPNQPSSMTPVAQFNRTTLGVYEMGSTFKLFTAAAALDAGIANTQTLYDAREPIKIASFQIRDYHPMHRHLTVEEIMIHSSNIGAARMALDLGTAGQKDFMKRIGMLKPTALELPEQGSPLYPATWREINTMTIAYGHGLSVTPMHLAAGVATLVNGGIHRPVTLLKRPAGEAAPGARALSAKTSDQMRRLMRAVVETGTGAKAEAAGYRVGGQTGTAEKLGAGGGYARKALLSSFVGAFPIDEPRYVVLAMVDEPKGNKETFGYATGGWIAAPVVGRIVAQIGPMLGLAPVEAPGASAKAQQASLTTGERKVAAN